MTATLCTLFVTCAIAFLVGLFCGHNSCFRPRQKVYGDQNKNSEDKSPAEGIMMTPSTKGQRDEDGDCET